MTEHYLGLWEPLTPLSAGLCIRCRFPQALGIQWLNLASLTATNNGSLPEILSAH